MYSIKRTETSIEKNLKYCFNILKQVWDLLSDDQSLESQCMRSKYRKQVSFQYAREDNHPACWKVILRS